MLTDSCAAAADVQIGSILGELAYNAAVELVQQ